MSATTELSRVFRLGAVDLPDPDRTMPPEAVLAHYASGPFPALMGGKVSGGDVEGNHIVYQLKKPEFKANG